jgi:hypothetical protein
MEMTLDYETTRRMVTCPSGGVDFQPLLDRLDETTNLDLYTMSTDWYTIGRQFIMKCKGTKGDLLVTWN